MIENGSVLVLQRPNVNWQRHPPHKHYDVHLLRLRHLVRSSHCSHNVRIHGRLGPNTEPSIHDFPSQHGQSQQYDEELAIGRRFARQCHPIYPKNLCQTRQPVAVLAVHQLLVPELEAQGARIDILPTHQVEPLVQKQEHRQLVPIRHLQTN